MTVTQQFDPVAYKQTTLAQWDRAAAAWDDWGPTLDDWLDEATAAMLDLANVAEGTRVLDVAAGAGGQSVAAARRVGPGGRVLATDISPGILARAQRRFELAGLANAATRVMDGEHLTVEPGSFDAVISRLGVIYFPSRPAALASARAALRAGGRIAVVVYGPAEQNGFFSVPVSIIRQAAGLGPPAPGQPGPFSLGLDGVLARELAAADFHDIEVREVDAPLRMPSAAECLRFEQESFGALHQMLAGLPEAEREWAWSEAGTALRQFEHQGGFTGPCRLLVGAGTR
ncbi:MAG TPA: class I SAM-dependent methyltransferase [Streptosporangiaceae bacterium]|nr:class I SAM-dependent methyltransferase [Streptosporangiaceae bacterium]